MSRLTSHYETLRRRQSPVDFDLGSVSEERLRERFVAVDGRETVTATFERETLITMGVSMTGPPHLGTVGQLYTAIELQEAGLPVQLVLADLEPYHGGQESFETVQQRARAFRRFALDLGFDPERGRLRTQHEADEVFQTAAALAPYFDRDDLEPDSVGRTDWERAVEDAYGRHDTDAEGPTSETARRFSALLHGTDFLHPLAAEGYDAVVIVMGADEHRLVPWTRNFLATAPVTGEVAGLYTRMISGLDDAPKMGRSLPGSSLSLADDPAHLRDRIRSAPPKDDPRDSIVVQATKLAAPGGTYDPDQVAAACRTGGAEWEAITAQYADLVTDLAEWWQSYEREQGADTWSEADS